MLGCVCCVPAGGRKRALPAFSVNSSDASSSSLPYVSPSSSTTAPLSWLLVLEAVPDLLELASAHMKLFACIGGVRPLLSAIWRTIMACLEAFVAQRALLPLRGMNPATFLLQPQGQGGEGGVLPALLLQLQRHS